MDIRKHGAVETGKQSERFLGFVRTHRRLVGLLAVVLAVGFAVWLTWTVTGQVRRDRVAVKLEELKDRGKKWETERAQALKAQQQSEAEKLLPPSDAAKSNTEKAQAESEQQPLTSGGEKAPAATSGEESPNRSPNQQAPNVAAEEGSPVAESGQQSPVTKVDQEFSAYLQQLIGGGDAVVQVEALWWQTRLREKEEDFSGAQESLAKIYQDFPRQPSARSAQMRSALLYYQHQQDERAVEQWDLLRAGDDGVALAATLQLGMVRTRRGEYEQARALLERFLNESAKVQQTGGWQDLADSYLLALDVLEQANNDGEGRQEEPPVVAPAPTAESQSAQQ